MMSLDVRGLPVAPLVYPFEDMCVMHIAIIPPGPYHSVAARFFGLDA
jgi:hypothetical protein